MSDAAVRRVLERSDPALAVLGASPTFAEPLHVGRPNSAIASGSWSGSTTSSTALGSPTTAPSCASSRQRSPSSSACATASPRATPPSALEIAIRALGLTRRGDRAVVHVRRHRARAAVAGDHAGLLRRRSRDTHNLDPDRVEALDHAADHRHHRRAPLGPRLRRRRAERDRRPARAEAALRRGPRLRLLAPAGA